MNIENQINNLIDTTLNANRYITDRREIEQSSSRGYGIWHNIGLLLHNNFITTHLMLVSPICACSYVPLIPVLSDAEMLETALRAEMNGTVISNGNIIINEGNKYLGAQQLIDTIYEKYIAIITKFQGASTNVSGAAVDIDITLYHTRIRRLLLQSVVAFINSIQHDYFSTGSDLFEKIKDFNKNLAKLLYDPSLHFIMQSDGVYTLITASGVTSGPLPYSGAVYS